jgi:hydrogenase expression/formation protein HypC
MCLAIPMQIVDIIDEERATVKQGETDMEVNTSLLENPQPGDYVIVHAGFAIETLDTEEAEQRIELFDELLEDPNE